MVLIFSALPKGISEMGVQEGVMAAFREKLLAVGMPVVDVELSSAPAWPNPISQALWAHSSSVRLLGDSGASRPGCCLGFSCFQLLQDLPL